MEAAPVQNRTGTLAQLFQEPLTVVARLRAQRQNVQDAGTFREQFRTLLTSAAQQARGSHSTEDIRKATFAVVGFLDESVLNSGLAAFSNWARKPLQEELFGTHMAGELFFSYLESLLTQENSAAVADVLEVYCLCLLLGFRGRYSKGGDGDLKSLLRSASEKLRRCRGGRPALAPAWNPPDEASPARKDPWLRMLTLGALAIAVLTIAAFTTEKLVLEGAVDSVQVAATAGARGAR